MPVVSPDDNDGADLLCRLDRDICNCFGLLRLLYNTDCVSFFILLKHHPTAVELFSLLAAQNSSILAMFVIRTMMMEMIMLSSADLAAIFARVGNFSLFAFSYAGKPSFQ